MAELAHRHSHRRRAILCLLMAVTVLSLGYAGSRTLPLLTPHFGEWTKDVGMSNGRIGPFLSLEATHKVRLPPPPRVDEYTDADLGPLLQAFTADRQPTPAGSWRPAHARCERSAPQRPPAAISIASLIF